MSVIGTTGPEELLPENPTVQELTHGGFRQHAYHQWIEDNADPRHMGRELLKQTTPIDTADEACVSDIMAAASPQGTDGQRVSKWSK